jgi:methenyltetrahydromethanopterin cyclohydrolase
MYYCNKCGQEMVDSGHRCAVQSERLTSVVRSNATTGWIKISERLPEEGIYVIAFEPHCVNNPDKGIGICEVDSDFTAKKSDGSFWITHWMPLPDAPEV